jgi:PAS domain S-box-containing protein
VTGWTEAEALGRPLQEVFVILNEESREPAHNPVDRVLREGATAGLANHTLVSKDGREVNIDDSAAPIRDAQGQLAGAMMVFRDVSQRRHEERERASLLESERDAREAAETAEQQLRIAVEAAPAAMIMVDEAGRIVLVNALTEQLFGYSKDEILGQPIERLVPDRYRDRHRDHRSGFSAEARQRPMGAARDLFALRKDGSEVPVEIGLSPLQTPEGRFVLSAVSDISARKEAEAALLEANRHKDEFLAMLSHELRNPLGAIVNATHLLKQLGQAEGNLKWARDVIDRQTRHLARIVDDLMDVSRIARGKIVLSREPTPVASPIAMALDSARSLIDARHQKLTSSIPGEPIWVDGDATRLAQVLGNLLNNAAKYTPPGGTISLSVEREEAQVVVRVRDTGIGISAEMLPRVFDLFVQAEAPLDRTQAGLGLGLTLARRLTELHGGTLEARSAGLGQGSEFVVRLPALETAPAARDRRRIVGTSDSPQRRILIVDDNADAAEGLMLALSVSGHEVRAAADGPAALQAVEQFQPDVVLLDIGLPGMDGYEVARRIRAATGQRGVVLVALTGYGQPEDIKRAFAAGFDHHLVKPVDPDAILAMLSSRSRRSSAKAATPSELRKGFRRTDRTSDQ